MLVKFEDQEFDFDLEKMTLTLARLIKRQCGLTIRGLMDGLEQIDPEALVALYWLMKQQAGVTVDMNKVNFNVLEFAAALGDSVEAENEREEEADPTPQAPAEAPATT